MRHPHRRANARMMPDRDGLRSTQSACGRRRTRCARRLSPGPGRVRRPVLGARGGRSSGIYRRPAVELLRVFGRSPGRVAASARPLVPPSDRIARAGIRGRRRLPERNPRGSAAVSAAGTPLRAGASEPDRTPDPSPMGTLARISRSSFAAGEDRAAGAARLGAARPDAGSRSLRELPEPALPLVLSGRRLPSGRLRPARMRRARAERKRTGMSGARLSRAARLSRRGRIPVRRAPGAISHAGVHRLGRLGQRHVLNARGAACEARPKSDP